MPTILLPGVLRAEAGGAPRLTFAAGPTLGDVLARLATEYPRLDRRIRDEAGALRRYVNVYVDGEDCRRLAGLGTPVAERSEIQVLPSVAGG